MSASDIPSALIHGKARYNGKLGTGCHFWQLLIETPYDGSVWVTVSTNGSGHEEVAQKWNQTHANYKETIQ